MMVNKVFAQKKYIYAVKEQQNTERCFKLFIHILNIIFALGYTVLLQSVKELKYFGTIPAPAEMQVGCKEKTNLATIIVPDLDLTVLLIMFVICLTCIKCVFIPYEDNFQSNF